MSVINSLRALEILDSRGRPTVKCWCILQGGAVGAVSVPSGASTGAAEALELRDGDPARYRGLGCRKAVAHIEGEIQAALRGRNFADQAALDDALIALDGTPNKARLGANALLAVSVAFARARSVAENRPLYRVFADSVGAPLATLPRPMINLFSGGKHAGGQVAIQDVQIMPLRAETPDELLAVTVEVFQTAADLIKRRFGMRLLTADEGGLAPEVNGSQALLDLAVEAITAAGFTPGVDVALTLDVAASHFHTADGGYDLDGQALTTAELVGALTRWLEHYPIASLEDGLAEDDWAGWRLLREQAAGRALILGDDHLCTNPARIRRAAQAGTADALLLKVNQIGTLTEAAEANRLAREAGWKVVVSARSGETEDDWLADLAFGWQGDHLKVGAITQSERLAKYNRLLDIARDTGATFAPFRS
jgi:enolase